ncbi:MAG TPA: cation diffusion facilitator family transporter [Candidatus Omnitrophota bacterium]|nr:cation diffusion facilitator family transporter [Candidatus Omnitrophota bacterium]
MMEDRVRQANRITVQGLVLNIFLTGLKLFAGYVSHSQAIVADAFHSLSDLSTDLVLLWGIRAAAKPIDEDHDYGHGKTETMVSAFIGFFLFLVGTAILIEGGVKIVRVLKGSPLEAPGWFACFAALLSIVSKEWLFRKTVEIGRKINNQGLIANAWHHRSDAFSSIGVMLGIAGAIMLGESWHILDPVAAVIVSVFIIQASFSIMKESFFDLSEGSLSPDIESEILALAASVPGAENPHKLRTRRVGHRSAIELHIWVDPALNIVEAHDIATAVEQKLHERFGRETFISIHVEPLKEPETSL